ncbi:unnamed protein product [Prorocentrum cordatum]|uniref:Helicase-associated domain-containing protein n=1 Tax=Prorocentrum cordatum TaxID=2364126 RepID=A0ABN9U3I5_9DINO|nr:unnamed protein product [Polarella glacialis]
MPRYEPPEVEQAPLERLCLRLRQLALRLKEQVPRLGQMLGQSPTAAQLMEALVQQPTEERLEEARASLVECGALNSTIDERASMTVLGQLALALPLDLRLCRLVLFGALFGCLADAVVMATALSLQDPLARPVGGLACDRNK